MSWFADAEPHFGDFLQQILDLGRKMSCFVDAEAGGVEETGELVQQVSHHVFRTAQ